MRFMLIIFHSFHVFLFFHFSIRHLERNKLLETLAGEVPRELYRILQNFIEIYIENEMELVLII